MKGGTPPTVDSVEVDARLDQRGYHLQVAVLGCLVEGGGSIRFPRLKEGRIGCEEGGYLLLFAAERSLWVDAHKAVDLIVSIERTDRGRQVRDVLHVESFSAGQYQTQSYARKEEPCRVTV